MLRGVLAILFGLLAFLNPGITMLALVWWVGIFLCVDGALGLYAAIAHWRSNEDKWMVVLEGALTLLLGILIVSAPGAYSVFVAILLGVWAIFAGSMRIAMAIQVRKEIEGEGWIMLGGALAVLFGLIVIAQPGVGITTLMYLLGAFAILLGIVFVVIGLKMRQVRKKVGDLLDSGKDALSRIREKAKDSPRLGESS